MEDKCQIEIPIELQKEAIKALYFFAFINVFALVFFLLGENDFAAFALGVQLGLLLLWIFPVFVNNLFVKKNTLKLAGYKALASYNELMGHVNWNH